MSAAAKYFHAAASDDDVPLCFQFSGTVFYACARTAPCRLLRSAGTRKRGFALPARVWREMMDHYYPNSAWLRLRRDVFDRLYEYKRRQGLATWEQAIENLLPLEKEAAS